VSSWESSGSLRSSSRVCISYLFKHCWCTNCLSFLPFSSLIS
jgi:hypothetical protein